MMERKYPERDDKYLTNGTKLLEKKREISEVEDLLKQNKEEFKIKAKELEEKKKELNERENKLKDSFKKFDKFLEENDAKSAKALKKAEEEKESQKQKQKEIEKLKEDLALIQAKQKRLEENVAKYKIFNNFLEATVKSSEEFEEICDVISWYETLIETYQDLMNREQKYEDRIEEERNKMIKYTEEKQNEILQYNNKLAELQTRFDKAQNEAIKWESRWAHIKNTAAMKTLLLGQIRMATYNLFQTINQYIKTEVEMENTSEQLTEVQHFIKDWSEIVEEVQKQEKVSSTQPQLSYNT
ncbi:coiled-coil domain-containing protein 42 homolog isoform X2 [Tachypleus tridentatus]|uniref:coiled-coil domain-containing protein 42 homolog isoform X2 n=1 Tax=Tachypleus tridentatus TaxID=6853 RepID=UPI003FD002F9